MYTIAVVARPQIWGERTPLFHVTGSFWVMTKRPWSLGMDDTDGNEIYVQLSRSDVRCTIIWADHDECVFWRSGVLSSWHPGHILSSLVTLLTQCTSIAAEQGEYSYLDHPSKLRPETLDSRVRRRLSIPPPLPCMTARRRQRARFSCVPAWVPEHLEPHLITTFSRLAAAAALAVERGCPFPGPRAQLVSIPAAR